MAGRGNSEACLTTLLLLSPVTLAVTPTASITPIPFLMTQQFDQVFQNGTFGGETPAAGVNALVGATFSWTRVTPAQPATPMTSAGLPFLPSDELDEPISAHGTAVLDVDLEAMPPLPAPVEEEDDTVPPEFADEPSWLEGDGVRCTPPFDLPSLNDVEVTSRSVTGSSPASAVGGTENTATAVEQRSAAEKPTADPRHAIKMRIRRLSKEKRATTTVTASDRNKTDGTRAEQLPSSTTAVPQRASDLPAPTTADASAFLRTSALVIVVIGALALGVGLKLQSEQETAVRRKQSVGGGLPQSMLGSTISAPTPVRVRSRPLRRCSTDCGLPI